MQPVIDRKFTADELNTWESIVSLREKKRKFQVIDIYNDGFEELGLNQFEIPQLWKINNTLYSKTGFSGRYVTGLEDGSSFYRMLANRVFPIGNFVRDKEDLSYTPAPDMLHDLFGHIPFLMDEKYANFCHKFGESACKVIDNPEKLRKYERFFWFTIEFGLIQINEVKQIFGAGIASSLGECDYALSNVPEVIDFEIDCIINQEFKIDEMQNKLFILKSVDQLYDSLDELNNKIQN